MTTRSESLEDLHPAAYAQFVRLTELLADDFRAGRTKTLFRVFETYRSPEAQEQVYINGTSKARAWQSAHQYGLAVDYVPWDDTWSWDETHDWDWLKQRARSLGLDVPIAWDKPHVQHPHFLAVRAAFKKRR